MAHMSFTHLQYAIPTDTTSYNQDEVSRLCSEVDALRGELKRLRESDTTAADGGRDATDDACTLPLVREEPSNRDPDEHLAADATDAAPGTGRGTGVGLGSARDHERSVDRGST